MKSAESSTSMPLPWQHPRFDTQNAGDGLGGLDGNSAHLFVMRIVQVCAGLIVSVLVSRTLGPANRGIYFLIIAARGLVVGLGSLGLAGACTYYMGKKEYSMLEINAQAAAIALAIGTLIIACYWLFEPVFAPHLGAVDAAYLWLGILTCPFALYGSFWQGLHIGAARISLISRFSTILSAVDILSTFVVLCLLDLSLPGLIGLSLVMSVAIGLCQWWLVQGTNPAAGLSLGLMRKLLVFGMKSHLGDIAQMVFTRADIFIVNYFSGISAVGCYSLSVSLAEKVSFFTSPIITASNPRISGAASPASAAEIIAVVSRHTLLIAITAALMLFASAGHLVPFLYGSDFLPSVAPLRILLPGVVFLNLAILYSSYFTYQLGQPSLPTKCGWATLLLNLPLCGVLTRHAGIAGAAISVAASYFFLLLLFFFLFQRVARIPLGRMFVFQRDDLRSCLNFLGQRFAPLRVPGVAYLPKRVTQETT